MATEPPTGFEALDSSAAINLVRGMTPHVFGPMLQETEETAYSNEPILPTKLTVSITKPMAGCEASTAPICKTSTVYAETSNVDAPQFGFRTKPGFAWTVVDAFEYPKGKLPHCILVELRDDGQQTDVCVTDAGQEETAAFNGDVMPLSEAESVIARGAPVTLSKRPDSPWSVGFVGSGTRAKNCKDSNAIPECKSFLVGLVTDGAGHDFAFRTPAGFAMKVAEIKTTPQCLAITFDEQLRTANAPSTAWPTRKTTACVSPEGFVATR